MSHAVEALIHKLWRGHPNWPSTFSKCPTERCQNLGRGGDFCTDCTEEALAFLVGPELAREYHGTVKAARRLERRMIGVDDSDP